MEPIKLSKGDITHFQVAGVIILRNVISPEHVEMLRKGLDKSNQNPSKRSRIYEGNGRMHQDFVCWDKIPEYREVIFNTQLPNLAAQLLRSRTIRLFHDHTLIKEAKTPLPTPWHQDTPYYNMEGNQTISFWIPVDPVPLESAMEFVVGSHKWPWMMPRSFKTKESLYFPEGSLPDIPDISGHRSEYPIASWAMEPGDVVAFNFHTMHSSGGVSTIRRVLSVRYIGDDVVYAPRKWATSPHYPELEEDTSLKPGESVDHPLFPIVFPKSKI